MADDLNEAPDDSIASALASAIAEHETASGDSVSAEDAPAKQRAIAAEKPAAEAKPEQSDSAPQSKEATAAPETAAAGDRDDKTAAADKPSDKPATDDKTIEAEITGKWSAADKELLKKLPAEGRNLLIRRHKEMEAAFTKKTQDFAEFRREYDPVNRLFDPYRERMKAGGWTPFKLIEAWSNVEKRLMEGDAVNVIAGLVRGYKVDLGQVARSLGLRPRPQPNGHADPNGAQPSQPERQQPELQLPPQIVQQLQSIQDRLDADDRDRADYARRAQTTNETRVMNEIDQFKSALDDKGDLQHPHFDEVEEAMTHLAQSALAARKPVPPLKELYETAVWATPKLREETLAARDRAQQEKAASEARAKAAQARKAGSSVTGAPGPGGQATNTTRRGDRSLREELDAAFSDQQTAGRI